MSSLSAIWPFSTESRYQATPTDEEELKSPENQEPAREPCPGPGPRFILLWATVIVLALVATVCSAWKPLGPPPTKSLHTSEHVDVPPPSSPTSSCGSSLSLRREWRTLSHTEQSHYISSVRCLLSHSSTIQTSRSSYADFPSIHSHVFRSAPHSAPSLPWHRYFLHTYESTLRAQCGFHGDLPYWDWTLDAADLASSPLLSASTGDNNVDGQVTLATSKRCVADGPFADIVAEYNNTKPTSHCLPRSASTLGRIDSKALSPESIKEVLQIDDYEEFANALEVKVRDMSPFSKGGAFESFTTPTHPLFFLHHAQMDRLWWMWQQRDPQNRMAAAGDPKSRHVIAMATLDDDVDVERLAPPVKVKDVLETEWGFLCYRY